MFNNKKQVLCSNNLRLEIKNLQRNCICSAVLYGSETWTLGKSEECRKCIWNMDLEKNVKNKMDT